MRIPGLAGPSNPSRSPNVDAERSVNLYPEVVDGGTGATRMIMRSTPGMAPFVVFPGGPARALWSMDNRCFAVVGNRLFELFLNQTGVQRGIVQVDGQPATITGNGSNGHQLLITSAGRLYLYDLRSGDFAEVSDASAPYPVSCATFCDGYFVALMANSNRFYLSTLYDGTSWNALDVGAISTSADQVLAMVSTHRELLFFGSQHTHIWGNTGASNFPFEQIGGVEIEHGVLSPWSLQILDNTVYWIGQDVTGKGLIWRLNGYTPERVCTQAVEYRMRQSGRVEDALGWSYSDEGHAFYVVTIPGGETTWVYDVATGLWHERALWDDRLMTWQPMPGRCHAMFGGQHLVGDETTGAIYAMNLDTVAHTFLAKWDAPLVVVTPPVIPPTVGVSGLMGAVLSESGVVGAILEHV
jgi:hypothetical protein